MKASVYGRAIVIAPPLTSEKFLMTEVTIECETCGSYTIIIAGHHLKAVVQILQEFIDAEPKLADGGTIENIPLGKRGRHTPENN